jgi:hypothetical protein
MVYLFYNILYLRKEFYTSLLLIKVGVLPNNLNI